MVFDKLSKDGDSGKKGFIQFIKAFLSSQKDKIRAQRSSPPLHGINLTQGKFTSSRQVDYPGYESNEEINPLK